MARRRSKPFNDDIEEALAKSSKLSNNQVRLSPLEIKDKYGTKSNAIRTLHGEGYSVKDIASILNIRYQHARNVINRPLKREIKKERDAANNAKETEQ